MYCRIYCYGEAAELRVRNAPGPVGVFQRTLLTGAVASKRVKLIRIAGKVVYLEFIGRVSNQQVISSANSAPTRHDVARRREARDAKNTTASTQGPTVEAVRYRQACQFEKQRSNVDIQREPVALPRD